MVRASNLSIQELKGSQFKISLGKIARSCLKNKQTRKTGSLIWLEERAKTPLKLGMCHMGNWWCLFPKQGTWEQDQFNREMFLAGFPQAIWLFSLVISPQGHRKEFRSELVFRSQSEVRVSV